MPLFKQNSPEPSPPPQAEPTRKGTLFGRRQRSASPDRSNKSNRTRNSSDSDSVGRAGSTRSGGLFGGRIGGRGFPHNDPTIMSAREKVSDAEESEKAADRALQQARASVKAAKDHVKFLEKEAEDDAHRARLKQAEAKVVSRSARGLGRHG
ncbi:hypothetical protein F5879DRAFT_349703 [Lentinula edodes]|uniref:Uncharacterized protein n=1 Tax=Lentinula edodes TaxID=5353 RepID=A0A1Q3E2N5_LENED|nr:uncharacterized protein C8R40DRAFT_1115905 [Lentinula edodes]KAF8828576.1 hypothetical protein HHX47_DHR3000012 [Lentinula edodes]KAH7872837.1 hypothetical protein C8R40DRAFT_1115905 [Lentinula edodes]KAJ3901164.1 hypothetical protein F5879DRAFT_349703 [Lentinula edodes]KAJ3916153.1 hypothetical protein F5877DRAFT_69286 [Lentinula edodes]GAW01493.1 hypothetical protein LENED_003093 [Lentinula edodes]